MAKLLTLVYIADVYLDSGGADGLECIEQSHAGVGVRTGVEHDAVVTESHFVYLVYQVAFVIALVVSYLDVGIALTQGLQVGLKPLIAIDAGLSFAQKVQIRSVDNLYFHLFFVLLWGQRYEEI